MITKKEKIGIIAEEYINQKGDVTARELFAFIQDSNIKFRGGITRNEISGALTRMQKFGHYPDETTGRHRFYMR